MNLYSSSFISKESTPFRKKRRRQQDIHNAYVSGVDSSYIGNSVSPSLSLRGLRQSLLSPPCRVYDGVRTSSTALQYVVLPGFFAAQSERVKVSRTRGRRVPPSGACCKASLRTLLMLALDGARQTIGAVDKIPNDSLLVVAFAGVTSPTCHDNYSSSSCRDCSVYSPSFANGDLGSVSISLQPSQRLEVVGLCVASELSLAYRLHCKTAPLSLSLSSSEFTSKSSASSATTATAIVTGGSASSQCASNEKNDRQWEEDTTAVGDTWCVGSSFCGIHFFWVFDAHRRSGIATMLVELARQNVSYGFEIPAEQVAFSEPTVYGKRFARRYTGRPDFLIF